MRLIDVPWDDVLFPYIMDHLTIKDLVALRNASDEFRELVNHYVHQLKTLDMSQKENASFTPDEAEGYTNILQNCRSLEHLLLRNCTFLEDHMLKPVFSSNPDLICVNLSKCTRLTSSILQPLAVNCKNVQVLVLSGVSVTPGAMQSLTYHLKRVIYLDVSDCDGATESMIVDLAQSWPQLRSINLSLNGQITDKCLITLADCCPYLERLTVKRCPRVTPQVENVVRELALNLQEFAFESMHVPVQSFMMRVPFIPYR